MHPKPAYASSPPLLGLGRVLAAVALAPSLCRTCYLLGHIFTSQSIWVDVQQLLPGALRHGVEEGSFTGFGVSRTGSNPSSAFPKGMTQVK